MFSEAIDKGRNVVERCVGWLKQSRRLSTRYEKLAVHYLSMIKLAFIDRFSGSSSRQTRRSLSPRSTIPRIPLCLQSSQSRTLNEIHRIHRIRPFELESRGSSKRISGF